MDKIKIVKPINTLREKVNSNKITQIIEYAITILLLRKPNKKQEIGNMTSKYRANALGPANTEERRAMLREPTI